MSKTQSRLGVTIPNQDQCLPINFYIPPFDTDVGIEVVLHVSGITNVHPLWDTWKWQISVNFLGTPPDLYSTTPTWVDAQTGGLTFTVGTDDTIVRVVLTDGDCVYWSNESGYENIVPITASIPYATVYKSSQVFVEGSGATKLDFTGATISNQTNGLLTTSVVNDNFVAAVTATPWEINYSGHLTFETALASTQRVIIAVFIDGVIVPASRQIVVVPEGTDYQIPFSKTYIQSVPLADTVDLRFDATLGDITAIDTTLTLKGLTL